MRNFRTYDEQLDYLYDLVEKGSVDWEDANRTLDLKYNPDSLRKSFNTTKFSGYEVMKHFKNKGLEYSSDEEIERIESLKDALYKERVKYQDVMREKRTALRTDSRLENLIEVVKDYMEFLQPIKLNKLSTPIESDVEAHLGLSDVHFGLDVDNVLNVYNKKECIVRFEKLLSKVITHCKTHNVSLLHISLIGDIISGAIHINGRVEQEEDLISQIIDVSEILSHFINELKKHINVKIYGVCGNHSRVHSDKKQSIKSENYERLIFKYVEKRINQPVIRNGYEDFINFKIKDREIVISHGDKDNVSNAKKHYCDVLNKVPDEIWLGHYHHLTIKDDNGTEVIVNGSFIGIDDYALGLRCSSKAYQMLKIYGQDDCMYKLELN